MQLSRCAGSRPCPFSRPFFAFSSASRGKVGLLLRARTLKTIQEEERKRHALEPRGFLLYKPCLSARYRPRNERPCFHFRFLPRKEVIQPHLPIRLPCYDFTPVIDLTFGGWLLAVTSPTSGAINSHGVTGGVYKARERIHRGMLIRDY